MGAQPLTLMNSTGPCRAVLGICSAQDRARSQLCSQTPNPEIILGSQLDALEVDSRLCIQESLLKVLGDPMGCPR